jgi:hypothetical protein
MQKTVWILSAAALLGSFGASRADETERAKSKFLDVEEGITDYAYLITLANAAAAADKAGKKPEAVKEAKAFLAALERTVPPLPGSKGMPDEGDGALVGKGVDDDARLQAPRWRETIAGLLKKLQE